MKSKQFLYGLILIIFSLVIFLSCTKKTTNTEDVETTETILQFDVLEQTETISITAEEIPPIQTEEDEIATLKNVRIYTEEDFKNVEPIFDIDMVLVEGGTMEMRDKMVSVDSFYMNRYELTWQMAYRVYIWANKQGYKVEDFYLNLDKTNNEINNLYFLDAILFCNYLSMLDGYRPVYYKINTQEPILHTEDMIETVWYSEGDGESRDLPIAINWEADGYRLPTEAEWEFAARGGRHSKGYIYSGSNNLDEVAWFCLDSGESNIEPFMMAPTGQKKPNELGLYDMSGNAAEWVINSWQREDMLVPEHNPGRIDNVDDFNILQMRGGCINDSISNTNELKQYIPQNRTFFYSLEKNFNIINKNSSYDIMYPISRSVMNTIRLVRSIKN